MPDACIWMQCKVQLLWLLHLTVLPFLTMGFDFFFHTLKQIIWSGCPHGRLWIPPSISRETKAHTVTFKLTVLTCEVVRKGNPCGMHTATNIVSLPAILGILVSNTGKLTDFSNSKFHLPALFSYWKWIHLLPAPIDYINYSPQVIYPLFNNLIKQFHSLTSRVVSNFKQI